MLYIILFLLSALPIFSNADNLKEVDPMIGTDGIGHTSPAATVPFGMVQVGPTNDYKGWNWSSGYHYSDTGIEGFAHNFISGAGLTGLGDILLMPTNPKKENVEIEDFHSTFSHRNEITSPGYYSVFLDTHNVFVELTAGERLGIHRYTFTKGGLGKIYIDPTYQVAETVGETHVKILDNKTLIAEKHVVGWSSGNRVVYACIKFSKPFDAYKEGKIGYVLYRNLKKNEAVEVQVSLSYVDEEGAINNFKNETSGNKDFDDLLKTAEDKWKRVLGKIEVESSDSHFKRSFYTALYHAYFSPNLISDCDNRYVVEGKQYKSTIPQYSNYSTWDTFRALHPLFSLIEHEKNAEFINSMVSRHAECGLKLPLWECLGFDNCCMIGQSMVPVISDGILKDIEGVDQEKAYEAMRFSINESAKNSVPYGPNGMSDYIINGYVTDRVPCSVAKTMEYNYFDWCLAQVAKKLGHTDDYLYFQNRSMKHQVLYDRETGYFLPVDKDGATVGRDSTDSWTWLIQKYVSGNIWGYSTFAPHNFEGLVRLHGGREQFVDWMDRVFTDNTNMSGSQHVDISGFIGKYAHGDEPAHHMIYLYVLAGEPHKARMYLEEVMRTHYSDTPGGLVNNDDLGQMSAWYIFTSMGFYPVNPCSNKYVIGRPFADKVTLHLSNGKDFIVNTKYKSEVKKEVESVLLNGKEYSDSEISYDMIMQGGELTFVFK